MDDYTIHEVTDRHQLDAVVEVIWKAQYRPYMPSSSMLFPSSGYSAEDRRQALAASQDRIWSDHLNDKSGQRGWVYVQHRDQDIIAGAQWEMHNGSPAPNGCPKLNMYWWPDGQAKDFCEEMLQQAYTPRSLWMQRPHGGINTMVVHPEHRGRGVGGLFMKWTNQRLDSKGIEGFLEASDLGRGCYERHGYIVVMKLDFFVPAGKGDEWQKLAHDMKPHPWYAMWRPVQGELDLSDRTRPWQLGPSLPI